MDSRPTGRLSPWLASVAAMMPLAATALWHVPLAAESGAAPAAAFQPPEGPMLLTVTMRRPLSNGKEVLTRRSYAIRFVRESSAEGDGYRIDGELVDVTVEAPPRLAAMAELERKRPDIGLFPLHLDAAGKRRSGGEARPSELSRQAVDLAASQVGAANIGALEKAQAQAFVRAFQDRPGFHPWPEDLFRPVPGKRREQRTIPLVNGERGHVTVDITARTAGAGGLLASFTRTVTSNLDGDMRATYEQWTLSSR